MGIQCEPETKKTGSVLEYELTVLSAECLKKTGLFTKPDPFAIVSVGAEQIQTTQKVRSTCSPEWGKTLEITLEEDDVVVVQIYDSKKLSEDGTGFLGVVNIPHSFFVEHSLERRKVFCFELRRAGLGGSVEGRVRVALKEKRGPGLPGGAVSSMGGDVRIGQQTYQTAADLPIGWEERTTPTGRAYFVDHTTGQATWTDPRLVVEMSIASGQGHQTARHPLRFFDSLPAGWEQRVDREGRIFYVSHETQMVTRSHPIAMAGFSEIERARCTFQMKEAYFRAKMEKRRGKETFKVVLRRENILEMLFDVFQGRNARCLRQKVQFCFEGEEGVDFGGLTNEVLEIASRGLFDVSYGLFEYADGKSSVLRISTFASLDDECISCFVFAGMLIGFSLLHGKHMSIRLSGLIYRQLLGKSMALEDMKHVSADVYSSLVWMKENNVDGLGIFFTATRSILGQSTETALKQGGEEIGVTEENKHEYVDLMVEWYLEKNTAEQMGALKKGMSVFVTEKDIDVFSEKELEHLVAGIEKIDPADWKAHTVYLDCTEEDRAVLFFWRYVEKCGDEERKDILRFATGTTTVPMVGFRGLRGYEGVQPFTVVVDGGDSRLPKAHTCFNRIVLSQYRSYEEFSGKLQYAVRETEIFGLD
ncbi:MAG: E3 ubiquitin-protein ligase hulA [Amphiamblys sp. WSBS2006]|nr:MAG: E3 ubiquitin-protein ligase hulA [Amphiamblys sp. WSBS2006]